MRKKKFLLLLDDVWERLDLDEIGIPNLDEQNGSKVVFTTRSVEVCGDMEAGHKLKVEFLDEKESWELFRQKVVCGGGGDILNSPQILAHAKTIVRKCGGLPLALVTMGRAMANKRADEWRDAVEALHQSPSQVRGMKDVFTLLKFSYDSLDNDVLRSCVLYCSLFPGDYGVEKEQLIEYWAGEGFLDNSQNGSVDVKGRAIIGSLKDACFLENSEEESRVNMHDVVRSFALWVVSERSNGKFFTQASEGLQEPPSPERWNDKERISLLDNGISELTETPNCPDLSTLLLQHNNGLIKISDGFFESMPILRVLDLSFTSIKELPKSICRLVKVCHLDLSGTKISTVPKELASLTNLKHLNMQRNPYLRTVARGVLSGLGHLRSLNFYYSYSCWKSQDFEELEGLRNLSCLGITITNLSTLKSVSLRNSLRKAIQYMCIKECEGLYRLPLSSYPGDGDQLRRFSISNCLQMKFLEIREAAGENWLPNLEILALNGLPNLTTIWKNRVSDACLQNLRCVNVSYCHKLKNVSWILRLPKLETLYIFYCESMEEVICDDDVKGPEDYLSAFPNLKVMSIRGVPELRSICKKALLFHGLKNLAVIGCPKLRKLPLRAVNVSELPTVYCYKDWWDNLEWDDTDAKQTLLPYFVAS